MMFQLFTATFDLYVVKHHEYTCCNIVSGTKIETNSLNKTFPKYVGNLLQRRMWWARSGDGAEVQEAWKRVDARFFWR
jgi:hypothetical protein